ncbi:hypothetical protein COB57_05025 [Candidatus Peregrinibacteria bacterium]|nr:MAG: hypothetical protein COB57_05025 [Candidatus Peregrinibacteria bacterium]
MKKAFFFVGKKILGVSLLLAFLSVSLFSFFIPGEQTFTEGELIEKTSMYEIRKMDSGEIIERLFTGGKHFIDFTVAFTFQGIEAVARGVETMGAVVSLLSFDIVFLTMIVLLFAVCSVYISVYTFYISTVVQRVYVNLSYLTSIILSRERLSLFYSPGILSKI